MREGGRKKGKNEEEKEGGWREGRKKEEKERQQTEKSHVLTCCTCKIYHPVKIVLPFI